MGVFWRWPVAPVPPERSLPTQRRTTKRAL